MDGPTRKSNRTSWLALMRAHGEHDLGTELVRLAKLAAATHQVEADLATETASDAAQLGRNLDHVRELQGRSSEFVVRTGARDASGDAGSFRREVER
ncbi:hypothetical protein ACERK3_11945 [Phycisphaerales bacterium AB-hyl4]|uniref:Uncharacterized protein n=1 Tax=Natronomicrosphaera hydrolytica TaxID=3242702 RepID=A0ABV4U5W6_9BACT